MLLVDRDKMIILMAGDHTIPYVSKSEAGQTNVLLAARLNSGQTNVLLEVRLTVDK